MWGNCSKINKHECWEIRIMTTSQYSIFTIETMAIKRAMDIVEDGFRHTNALILID